MPAPETFGRYQKALYWPAVLDNAGRPVFDRYGQPKVSVSTVPPTELMVRWDGTRRSVIGPQGAPIAIDATISHLDRDVEIGSCIWQGGLDDLYSAVGTALTPPTDLLIVKVFNSAPDPKGRFTYREALLLRFSDAMPSTS